MPDREKVIKGLECCIIEGDAEEVCPNCPYMDKHPFECTTRLMMDVLALLREQEAVLPLWQENKPHCGQCGEWLFGKMNFCTRCGRAVKWDA